MKLATFLFIITFLNISASNYAQNTKITLDLNNVTIEKALNKIESITEFKFLFNRKDIDVNKIISIKANKENVKSVLSTIFLNSPVSFEILDKQIILKSEIGKKTIQFQF